MIDRSCWSAYLKGRRFANQAIYLLILSGMTACQMMNFQTGTIPTPRQNVSEPMESIPSASATFPERKTSTPMENMPVNGGQTPTVRIPDRPRSIPPVWDFISDDFESGSLARWGEVSGANLSLATDGGHNGSTGLSVTAHIRETYLYKTDIMKTIEGYATFWFDPNSVDIPDQPEVQIPGKSIRIVDVKGYQYYDVIAGLRIWKPNDSGQGYKAYLEWQANDGNHFDLDAGQFNLANGWQKITLGFRINEWVAVWVNDVLIRQVTGTQHSESFGENLEFGKANDDTSITPVGAMRYDDVAFQIPRYPDLWVDATKGDDSNTGLGHKEAFRTIQKAANLAGPGTKIHILPGIYRESVNPATNGSSTEPTVYTAEAGPGTVIIRGAETSKSLTWHRLQANMIGLPADVDPSQIYYTDLSGWKLDGAPRYLVQVDPQGNVVSRLPLAREPDWSVKTEWKYHEFWWAADGGATAAGCDPATNSNPNCDFASRSTTQLTDRANDSDPAGIEPGNLTTLGDLTSATIVAIDTKQGHYVYRRMIIAHNVSAGRVTVDRLCEHDPGSGIPGLGWGTKYYVEGKTSLLDTPGEWWYDKGTGRLYLWPRIARNPGTMNIEISRQNVGFRFTNRSHIILDGLTLEFFNDSGVSESNDPGMRSFNNTVRNTTILYANHGIDLHQSVDDIPDNITSGFTLEHSEVAYMDTDAMHLVYYWKNGIAPDSFTYAGITNSVIKDNELHHLGFRSDRDSASGALIEHPDKLRFEGNHVHHVAHNGAQFAWSVIQSAKEYGFTPNEIMTGDILIKDNIFEKACQVTTDCGALKIWGDPPNSHVFRDVLITGNVFRDVFGWTYISEKRKGWSGGPSSDVRGMGGYGLYLDMASGIYAYRNIAYNNAFAGFMVGGTRRDGDMVLYNNVVANSLYGFFLTGFGIHKEFNTQLVNNIMVGNEGFGLWYTDVGGPSKDILVDHNLYYNNGWRLYENGGFWEPGNLIAMRSSDDYVHYMMLADVQASTPWETHAVEGNPRFLDYNTDDHNLFDLSQPNFYITADSNNAIDRGTVNLPDSLTRLLQKFGVPDQRLGSAFDIGCYEVAGVSSVPAAQSIRPGRTAHFLKKTYRFDFPYTLALTVFSPSADVTTYPGATVLQPGAPATITMTDQHVVDTWIAPDLSHRITLEATYAGTTQNTEVNVLVDEVRLYLPVAVK